VTIRPFCVGHNANQLGATHTGQALKQFRETAARRYSQAAVPQKAKFQERHQPPNGRLPSCRDEVPRRPGVKALTT
jgi:hypothetical protein